LLECEKAPLVEIHVDCLQRKASRNCKITAEMGSIFWDYHSSSVEVYSAETGRTEIFRQEGFERNQMYIDEMNHFIECLTGREKPTTNLAEARASLEVALAAKKSSMNGIMYKFPESKETSL